MDLLFFPVRAIFAIVALSIGLVIWCVCMWVFVQFVKFLWRGLGHETKGNQSTSYPTK